MLMEALDKTTSLSAAKIMRITPLTAVARKFLIVSKPFDRILSFYTHSVTAYVSVGANVNSIRVDGSARYKLQVCRQQRS